LFGLRDEYHSRKSGRKWHLEQEKLFVELMSLPEYKPIGGEGDGVMESKGEDLTRGSSGVAKGGTI
jgi:hypothetical protein